MNPYLEQEDVWHGFHERMISHVSELLVPQVRPNYIVTLDESAYIHELPAEQRRLLGRPDVGVAARSDTAPAAAVAATLPAAPAYGRVPLSVDVERLSYVQIRDRRSRRVVTVIELLSPANKNHGPDREQYLTKRRQYFASGVHLVEIDLLRGGPRLPLEDLPGCDYYVLVSRYEDRPRVALWPIGVREPLPLVPIPLRGNEARAKLDLQNALHHVYDAAGYEDYIYAEPPRPPLDPGDAAWAARLLTPP